LQDILGFFYNIFFGKRKNGRYFTNKEISDLYFGVEKKGCENLKFKRKNMKKCIELPL